MQNKCLTTSGAQAHHIFVAANNGDLGLATRKLQADSRLPSGFFTSVSMVTLWADRVGRPKGLPVPVPGSPTRHGSAHPFGDGERMKKPQYRSITMATHAPSASALCRTTARPKHSPAVVRGPHRRIGRARPAAPSPVTALRAIVLETMDYPPVRPTSADSFLPAPLLEAAQQALAAADRTARRPGRARLATSLSLYRVVRRLAGPVAAYRLSFSWSA